MTDDLITAETRADPHGLPEQDFSRPIKERRHSGQLKEVDSAQENKHVKV